MSALGGSELGVRGIIVCHLLRLSTFAGSWGLVDSRQTMPVSKRLTV